MTTLKDDNKSLKDDELITRLVEYLKKPENKIDVHSDWTKKVIIDFPVLMKRENIILSTRQIDKLDKCYKNLDKCKDLLKGSTREYYETPPSSETPPTEKKDVQKVIQENCSSAAANAVSKYLRLQEIKDLEYQFDAKFFSVHNNNFLEEWQDVYDTLVVEKLKTHRRIARKSDTQVNCILATDNDEDICSSMNETGEGPKKIKLDWELDTKFRLNGALDHDDVASYCGGTVKDNTGNHCAQIYNDNFSTGKQDTLVKLYSPVIGASWYGNKNDSNPTGWKDPLIGPDKSEECWAIGDKTGLCRLTPNSRIKLANEYDLFMDDENFLQQVKDKVQEEKDSMGRPVYGDDHFQDGPGINATIGTGVYPRPVVPEPQRTTADFIMNVTCCGISLDNLVSEKGNIDISKLSQKCSADQKVTKVQGDKEDVIVSTEDDSVGTTTITSSTSIVDEEEEEEQDDDDFFDNDDDDFFDNDDNFEELIKQLQGQQTMSQDTIMYIGIVIIVVIVVIFLVSLRRRRG